MMTRTSVFRGIAIAAACFVLAAANILSVNAFCDEIPRSNLSIFQSLGRDLGRRMVQNLQKEDSASVTLTLHPNDQAWILQGPLTEGLASVGWKSVIRDGDVSAECTISNMGVKYEENRRLSMFGGRLVDRVVNLSIQALIADRRSGKVLTSAEYATSARDTIEVSVISKIEDASVPVTRGEIPREGFFSTFAEPVIMIGAVAVAVLLLFHVRS